VKKSIKYIHIIKYNISIIILECVNLLKGETQIKIQNNYKRKQKIKLKIKRKREGNLPGPTVPILAHLLFLPRAAQITLPRAPALLPAAPRSLLRGTLTLALSRVCVRFRGATAWWARGVSQRPHPSMAESPRETLAGHPLTPAWRCGRNPGTL
jgi:hypothetical protein